MSPTINCTEFEVNTINHSSNKNNFEKKRRQKPKIQQDHALHELYAVPWVYFR